MERVLPALSSYIGQQITIIGRDLGNETVVEVGGIDVSGPPIHRTVLVNATSEELWEVAFLNESEILAWEVNASAAYEDSLRESGMSRPGRQQRQDKALQSRGFRRQKAGRGSAGSAGTAANKKGSGDETGGTASASGPSDGTWCSTHIMGHGASRIRVAHAPVCTPESTHA